jgi:poly(3-hydroxybutyrate) depolymerase
MTDELSRAQAALLDALRGAHHRQAPPSQFSERVLDRLTTPVALPPAKTSRWWLSLAAGVLLAGGALLTKATVESEGLPVVGAEPVEAPAAAVPAPFSPAGDRVIGPRPCPLAEAPSTAALAPEQADFGVERAGLVVHTLDLPTASCGPLRRRYVALVPRSLPPRTNAPVVLVLHDTGSSAEAMRAERSVGQFDDEARRAGFVLVYANGAPGAASVPNLLNSGGWQTDQQAHPEVDDEAYLEAVVTDLGARDVIGGHNPVVLVGYAGGATMALAAAVDQRNRYAAVVAWMPPPAAMGLVPNVASARPPHVAPPQLSRALFVLGRDAWSGPSAHGLARGWAAAFGITAPVRPQRWELSTAGGPAPVEQLDYAAPASGGPAVRVLMLSAERGRLPRTSTSLWPRAAWAFASATEAIPPDVLAGPPVAAEIPIEGFDEEIHVEQDVLRVPR